MYPILFKIAYSILCCIFRPPVFHGTLLTATDRFYFLIRFANYGKLPLIPVYWINSRKNLPSDFPGSSRTEPHIPIHIRPRVVQIQVEQTSVRLVVPIAATNRQTRGLSAIPLIYLSLIGFYPTTQHFTYFHI